eukprot:TRINITY_DN1424_c0_g1_i5.p1 TRINITY_DN1424_c0_g1~~TRINITY_DN1424_c0_g1_i5.p1  ORF type:complete len:287 (+),score=43.88 TRINITY_DN1424_c0_g1_i5:740-1600(+)
MISNGRHLSSMDDDDSDHPTSEFSALLARKETSGAPDNVTEVGTSAEFFEDGSYYIGEWEAHLPHGPGILTMPNGDRYEGNFENGMFHGTGMFLRANNPSQPSTPIDQSPSAPFSCCFRRNRSLSDKSGRVAKASSSQIAHSPVVLVEASVYTYAGQWKRGRQHGKGMQIWWNGYRFSGSFENGQPTGSGKLHLGSSTANDDEAMSSSKGSCVQGMWIDHVFEPSSTTLDANCAVSQKFRFDPRTLLPADTTVDSRRRMLICTSVGVLLIAMVLAGIGVYVVRMRM